MRSFHMFGSMYASVGLKWRLLFALSLVLILVYTAMVWLVHRESNRQLDAQQAALHATQKVGLAAVFAGSLDAARKLAGILPQLAVGQDFQGDSNAGGRIASAMRQHAARLGEQWDASGMHFIAEIGSDSQSVSWPQNKSVPRLPDDITTAVRRGVATQLLDCSDACRHVSVVPLRDVALSRAVLVVERDLDDILRRFQRTADADVVILRQPAQGYVIQTGDLAGHAVVAHTRDAAAEAVRATTIGQGVQRLKAGEDWYEVESSDSLPFASGFMPVLVRRVTGQLRGIHYVNASILWLGLIGVVLSGVMLLALLWAPMRRMHLLVRALPLLAEKSFAQLRDRLPMSPSDAPPRDEIDQVVLAIAQVTERIEALDAANRSVQAELRNSETGLQLAQAMARVVPWYGQPIDGSMSFSDGASDINPILAHVSGWSQFIAFVHPEDRPIVLKAWRSGRPGSVFDVEFRLKINHKQFDMHAVARFDAVGPARVLQASGMMQDVTEMRSVQRALRQQRDGLEEVVNTRTRELAIERNRAEHIAASKSQFLADMSHEIRTPLTAVLGLSQIGMQESQNRRIAETFQQILAAGDHLLGVVNDVLDYSKLEAGRLTVTDEPFELRWVVQRCADMFREAAARKGLALPVDVAEGLPEVVIGDRFRLQQVLINLLGNALKFTEQGEVSLDVYRASNQICFRVCDTGVGMTSKQLHRLFRPFYQSTSDDTGCREGTGLGLTISKRIATLMGGDIQVRSTQGAGSKFMLHLPLKEAEGGVADNLPVVEPASVGGTARLSGLYLLLADDVAVNRQVIEHLLRLEGAIVDLANDGSEAVDAMSNGVAYDAILMDVQMPGIGGREATRRIRRAGIDIPIIGVTAHVSAEERQASLAAGMQDQLVKPLMQETLVDTILAHLHHAPVNEGVVGLRSI